MLQKLLLTVMLTASLFGVEIVINKSQEMYKNPTFVRNSEKEIVTNTKTGLMWQDDTSVKNVKKTWSDAKNYCKNLNFAGYSDWFLPSISQLESLVDTKKYDPSMKKEFKNIISSYCWSSSSYVSHSNNAWSVYFKDGNSGSSNKTDYNYVVRCARAGQ
jgi:hypothetical protein